MFEVGGLRQGTYSPFTASVLQPSASNLQPQASNSSGGEHDMNTFLFPFEKLDVWQMAVNLVDKVLVLLEELPVNRHLRLVSQMEGAVTSISQNIAEGKGRQYKKEFVQFLSIAEGSLYETVTLIEVFRRRKLFREEDCRDLRDRCEAIDRKINGLRNSLRGASNIKPQTSNPRPPTLDLQHDHPWYQRLSCRCGGGPFD